jgi:Flp pilus assembly protein TadD
LGLAAALVAAGGLLGPPSLGGPAESPPPEATAAPPKTAAPPPDPLVALGYRVTGGAAPGYVEDRVCGICHRDLYRSYQEVGMARSFSRPRPDNDLEDFANSRFSHPPSGEHYEMVRRDGRLVFKRWQLDADGRPINEFEEEVDWILGSGHHSRTYLYQTPAGELYQLPLAWYSQPGRWGMSPGYDRPDHQGVTRRVRRECMFCHNAYPDVPAGSDAYAAPQVYPADLPEGTGCQRCHGPGAEHVRRALGGVEPPERVRESIVDPGALPPERRDDVCFECHLQPSVALFGVRRFDRDDYSFRPGQSLADYLVQVDVDEEGREPAERFEINHHPYRLRQSRCYLESGGALSCLTCHDPHRKVPPAERPAHYRAACLTCHQVDACGRAAMAAAGGGHLEGAGAAVDPGDCAGCHMPPRRTEDVVQVVMTDHLIRRRPGGPELLAPREESDPVLTGMRFLSPERSPAGALGEVYLADALVRAGGRAAGAAIDRLERALGAAAAAGPIEPPPWYDLAGARLRQRRFADAGRVLRAILERAPGDPQALAWLGIAEAGQGRNEEAIAVLRRALAADADLAETAFNLGRILVGVGRPGEALPHLERAIDARPNLAPAWHFLGEVYARLDRPDAAIAAWRRALAIAPGDGRAYLALGRALLARGDRAEALRVLRHGARAAARPGPVAAALAEVEAAPGAGR